MDVNGLHELNNTKGHDAGDVMLKIVAQEMTKIFGRKDTYRIGGDEFVAFVVDTDLRHVREMMQTLEQAVEAHGYLRGCGLRHLQRRRHPDQSPHQTGRDPDV